MTEVLMRGPGTITFSTEEGLTSVDSRDVAVTDAGVVWRDADGVVRCNQVFEEVAMGDPEFTILQVPSTTDTDECPNCGGAGKLPICQQCGKQGKI